MKTNENKKKNKKTPSDGPCELTFDNSGMEKLNFHLTERVL